MDSAQVDCIMKTLYRRFRKNLTHRGGSENSISYASLKRVLDRIHAHKSLDEKSVLVDLGSGAGLVCIYAALRYGCRTIGVEIEPALVELAREFAVSSGCSPEPRFVEGDVSRLGRHWFDVHNVTHVFSYDGVFEPKAWNRTFESLGACDASLCGASCSKFQRYWGDAVKRVAALGSVSLMGSKSSFNFALWEK